MECAKGGMQRGAVTLTSEERYSEEKEMEGYGPGNVFILRVARIFTNRVENQRTVVKFRFLRN